MKKIIILVGGLAEGRGDWEHLKGIAYYLKKEIGDQYKIVGFISPNKFEDAGVRDAEPYVSLFEKEFLEIDKEQFKESGILKNNDYFDLLFNGYNYELGSMYKMSGISKVYKSFVQLNQGNIYCCICISFLNACIGCIGREKHLFPMISMSEFGAHTVYSHGFINLNMGIGEGSHGLRMDDSIIEESTIYWEKLRKENPNFYDKILLGSSNPKDYFESRKLLPADLRNKQSILAFIKFNLDMFGLVCDFYLPAKFFYHSSKSSENSDLKQANQNLKALLLKKKISYLDGSEICKAIDQKIKNDEPITDILGCIQEYCKKYDLCFEEIYVPFLTQIEKIFQEYKVTCKYITQDSSIEDASVSEKGTIRIFYGFDLSDYAYKGLILYNKETVVGVSGDDGVNLAVLATNPSRKTNCLIFHGKAYGTQETLIQDMVELSKSLQLNELSCFFQCFLDGAKSRKYNHLS